MMKNLFYEFEFVTTGNGYRFNVVAKNTVEALKKAGEIIKKDINDDKFIIKCMNIEVTDI